MNPDPPLVDLDAYFERIQYHGPRDATWDTLRVLQFLHPQAIPFENLDPLLKRPIKLDAASLEEKLVRSQRGGYCYEHNLLFLHVLTTLGFQVSGLAARVVWNQPEASLTPRTHMLIRVELGGETYIADTGFGGQTLTAPMRLQPGVEQQTPHEPYRMIDAGNGFTLQAKLNGAWKSLYRFDLSEQLQPDYEMANYYVSTHSSSHFVNSLIAARVSPDGRHALLNNRLTTRYLNGSTECRELNSAEDALNFLEHLFGIIAPDQAEFHIAWEKINTGSAALARGDAEPRP